MWFTCLGCVTALEIHSLVCDIKHFPLQPQSEWSDLHWSHSSGQSSPTKQVTGKTEVSCKISDVQKSTQHVINTGCHKKLQHTALAIVPNQISWDVELLRLYIPSEEKLWTMINVPEKCLHKSGTSEVYDLSSMCPVIDMAYIFWSSFASSEST